MNKHVKAFYQKFSCLTDVDPEKHYCLLLAHQWALESTQALDEHCLRLGVSCELALDNFPYPPRLSVLELVELFELTCCNKDRDKEGKFYTPETVLQCMCTDLQFSNATTIFDPSCGAGAFLLVAADRILSANRGTYEDNLHTLNRCVFGIDRDSFAVTICKELLALLALRYASDKPKVDTCSLVSILHADTLDTLSNKEDLPQAFGADLQAGFDYIIGNPPYGLARGEKLSPEENKRLKAQYATYKFGKMNKYLIFMALCSKLLAPEGTLKLIVPNAWLGLRTAKELRKQWHDQKALTAIQLLSADTFPSARVEPVIFTYQNMESATELIVSDERSKRSFRYSYAHWQDSPDYCIPTVWNSFADTFFTEYQKECFLLGSDASPFRPYIALQAYAAGKGSPAQTKDDVKNHVFHSNFQRDPSYVPYADGRDILRFSYTHQGKFLRYGPWLAEQQPIERYSQPRIVLREILGKSPRLLSATFVDCVMVYNRSVLHVLSDSPQARELLLALLAIFNSKVGSFIIRFRGRKSQRKLFPKIVNDDLRMFPIPSQIFKKATHLAPIVEEQLRYPTPAIDARLDELVLELYGFSPNALPELEKSLLI